MSNKVNSVLYVGVTSDIENRVLQHKQGEHPSSFTHRYRCHKLVWFQEFDDIELAIQQEKRIKRWKRKWKEELIDASNAQRIDLSLKWHDPTDLE